LIHQDKETDHYWVLLLEILIKTQLRRKSNSGSGHWGGLINKIETQIDTKGETPNRILPLILLKSISNHLPIQCETNLTPSIPNSPVQHSPLTNPS